MNKDQWYFTFPWRLEDKRNKFVKIAGNYHEARLQMEQAHGKAWAMQYTEEEFLPQIPHYGLTEIPL